MSAPAAVLNRRKELGRGPFEQVPSHWKPGLPLSRVWRAPFTHGLTDPWRIRCEEYWERIEQRYGVVLTDHRNAHAIDDIAGPVVATYAAVAWILPAERTPARPKNTEETVQ